MALKKAVPATILEGFDQLKWSGNSTTPCHRDGLKSSLTWDDAGLIERDGLCSIWCQAGSGRDEVKVSRSWRVGATRFNPQRSLRANLRNLDFSRTS